MSGVLSCFATSLCFQEAFEKFMDEQASKTRKPIAEYETDLIVAEDRIERSQGTMKAVEEKVRMMEEEIRRYEKVKHTC